MADKGWKKFERRAAALFGSYRTPLSGGNGRQTRSDSLHPHFFIEAKLRQKFAHHELMKDTTIKAKVEKKIPVVLTQKKFEKGCLVTIKHSDMLAFAKQLLSDAGYTLIKKRKE